MNTEEIWKDIYGYEGCYQVSNHGRIKSLPRWVKGKRTGAKYISGCIIKGRNARGYIIVDLRNDGVKTKYGYAAHRLVALAFIPNPENKKTVNHKNGIRNDNRVENLEWATHSENCKHGFRILGRNPRRSELDKRSRKIYQYNDNLELIKLWNCGMDAEREGYKRSAIRFVCIGKKKYHRGFIWSYKPLHETQV